jgi:hypothetical protein
MKTSDRKNQPAKAALSPAKKSVANKVRYIARHRGMKVDAAWASIVGPVVDREFEQCVSESKTATARGA